MLLPVMTGIENGLFPSNWGATPSNIWTVALQEHLEYPTFGVR
jgi:hypothetical protein